MTPAERLERRQAIVDAMARRPLASSAVLRATLVVVYARALRGPIEPAR